MLHFILLGLIMGASSGLMPGPIFNFMISESLKNGVWSGFKVGIAPMTYAVVMIPIIFLLAYFFHQVTWLMIVIGFIGGGFIIKLSIETMRYHPQRAGVKEKSIGFWKASFINFMNPYAYIFWSTAGVSIVGQAFHINPLDALAFFISYYGIVAFGNTMIVCLIGRYRNMLSSNVYIWVMRFLGFVLFFFGANFVWLALKYIL